MIGYDFDGVLSEAGWFDHMRESIRRGERVAVLTTNTRPEMVRQRVQDEGLDVEVVRFKRSDLMGKAQWMAEHGGGTLYDDDPRYGLECARFGVRWVRV